jgi:F420-non-reducing hydrogenase large subunit
MKGHAKIVMNLTETGQVEKGHFQMTSVRGIEKFLEGKELVRMPLITGRVCGACPTAHHIAAVVAIERGLGVTLPPKAVALRNLLYAGHILHSHALSTFILLGPNMLGENDSDPKKGSVFDVLRMDQELGTRILRLRSIGQATVAIVGGRSMHPVAAVPGGIACEPTERHLQRLAEWGQEAVEILSDLLPRVHEKLRAIGDVREATAVPLCSLGISNSGKIDYIDGTVVLMDDQGNEEPGVSGECYARHLVEHLKFETAVEPAESSGNGGLQFFVGPLARLNVNRGFTTPLADELINEFRDAGRPRTRMVDYVEARLIEMVHCAEQIAEIAGSPLPEGALRTEALVRKGRFTGVIEAPRGLLIHDYTVDNEGIVTKANLIVATQNNLFAIDETVTSVSRYFISKNNGHELLHGIEFALRLFDPCLGCATHAAGTMPLEVEVRREGRTVRSLSRD